MTSLARLTMLKSKLFLDQTSSTNDDELKSLLESSTEQVNSYCNRTLMSTVYTDQLMSRMKFMPYILFTDEWPVTAIATLKFWDTITDAYVTETASYYELINKKYIQYPKLGQETGATYSEFPDGLNEIQITYTAGYVITDWATLAITDAFDVPADLEKAVCAIAHLAWQDGQGGAGRRGVTSINVGGQGLTKEVFQSGAFPKDVLRILDKYAKLVV